MKKTEKKVKTLKIEKLMYMLIAFVMLNKILAKRLKRKF